MLCEDSRRNLSLYISSFRNGTSCDANYIKWVVLSNSESDWRPKPRNINISKFYPNSFKPNKTIKPNESIPLNDPNDLNDLNRINEINGTNQINQMNPIN
jgi:hypothetical protein